MYTSIPGLRHDSLSRTTKYDTSKSVRTTVVPLLLAAEQERHQIVIDTSQVVQKPKTQKSIPDQNKMAFQWSCFCSDGDWLSDRERRERYLPSLPTRYPDMKAIDEMTAKELSSASMEERERIFQDLQGIPSLVEEDPEFVKQCLEQFDIEIRKVKSNTAYELAESMSLEYVSDRKFRLMFLRSDRFDARDAASRMVRFFEEKFALFGRHKLVDDIKFCDLDEDDMTSLRSGSCQVLPARDRAGRPILCTVPELEEFSSIDNVLRVHFYVNMTVVEDEDVQKSGITAILYQVSHHTVNRKLSWRIGRMSRALPVRLCSSHGCFGKLQDAANLSLLPFILGRSIRLRTRIHFGSNLEVMYKLSVFGIPPESLPITSHGETTIHSHLEWIEARRQIEGTKAPLLDLLREPLGTYAVEFAFDGGEPVEDPFVNEELAVQSDVPVSQEEQERAFTGIKPGKFDIIFGRGRGAQLHPGNARFRHILEMHATKYEQAGKFAKTAIAEEILGIIKSSSGRFLRQDERGGWIEVDEITARKKVAHAFRARRTKNNV